MRSNWSCLGWGCPDAAWFLGNTIYSDGGGREAAGQLLRLTGLRRTDLRQSESDLSPLRILFLCLALRKGFAHGRGQEGSSCPIVSVQFRWQTVSPTAKGRVSNVSEDMSSFVRVHTFTHMHMETRYLYWVPSSITPFSIYGFYCFLF